MNIFLISRISFIQRQPNERKNWSWSVRSLSELHWLSGSVTCKEPVKHMLNQVFLSFVKYGVKYQFLPKRTWKGAITILWTEGMQGSEQLSSHSQHALVSLWNFVPWVIVKLNNLHNSKSSWIVSCAQKIIFKELQTTCILILAHGVPEVPNSES